MANIRIRYRFKDFQHFVSNIDAVTYNLEDGKLTKTKVSKGDIYYKSLGFNEYEVSFSLASVHEGSIIEYSYEIVRPISHYIPTWNIQGNYPKLRSELHITYPKTFFYKPVSFTNQVIKEFNDEKDAINSSDDFCHVKRVSTYSGIKSEDFWVRKDIKPVKSEPYVNNMQNYFETFDVELSGVVMNNAFRNETKTWEEINYDLWEKLFGQIITTKYEFTDRILKKIINNETDSSKIVKLIYNYVRSSYKVSSGETNPKTDLEKVFAEKTGCCQDINMLLVNLLVNAGITANPVLLATTDYPTVNHLCPTADHFNYLIACVSIDTQKIFLDASSKSYCYGVLPLKCYNGYSRLIGKNGRAINLTGDFANNATSYFIKYSINNDTAVAEVSEKIGLLESSIIRGLLDKSPKDSQKVVADIFKNSTIEFAPGSVNIINRNIADTNLVIKYILKEKMAGNTATNYYLNTSLIKIFSKNPFIFPERKLPVEFNCQSEITTTFGFMVPKGMELANVPAPKIIDYENGAINYRKTISFDSSIRLLSIKTKFKRQVCKFPAEYYPTMKDYMETIMKDENTMLVFNREQK